MISIIWRERLRVGEGQYNMHLQDNDKRQKS